MVPLASADAWDDDAYPCWLIPPILHTKQFHILPKAKAKAKAKPISNRSPSPHLNHGCNSFKHLRLLN
jgi:hypothetical protein